MKTKLTILLVFGILVFCGNANGGVVGLRADPAPDSFGNIFANISIARIAFTTKGISGNKFTGISFASLTNIFTDR